MSLDLAPLLHHLRRMTAPQASDSDAALLRRFAHSRDESAFADLVARHGPLVLSVCRRVLGDPHAAEDAFQAAFLVLARKAGAIRRPAALSGWLYGVALRVAHKARSARCRQPRQPVAGDDPPASTREPPAELTARELLDGLDEEIQRLPEVYRLPVILCCLEGLSQEETARRLGWTPGSVKGRLERGRATLHARLVRRGLTLTAALAAVEATRGTAAAVSLALAGAAALAALAAGRKAAGVPAHVLALADNAAAAVAVANLKALTLLALALVLVGAGVGLLTARAPTVPQPQAPPEAATPPQGRVDKAADEPEEDLIQEEMKRLEGTWNPVAYQSGKDKVEGEEFKRNDWAQYVLTIKDGKYQEKYKEGASRAATIKIDPTKSPKTLDRIGTEDKTKGQVARSIYDLEGDRLRICTAFEREDVRPNAFDADGVYVIEYRRAADGEDDHSKSDKNLIQGTWEVVSMKEGAIDAPAESTRNMRMVFTADMWSWHPKDSNDPKDVKSIRYTLDPTKDPKEIDTSHEIDPGKPFIQLGVYSLEGDTLKLCLSAAGRPRPTKLESKAADGSVLFVLKRAGANKLRGQAVPLQGGVGGPVLFDPDGKHVVGGDAKTLCIWRTASGKLAHIMNPPGGVSGLTCSRSRFFTIHGVIGPRFCPDSSWLAGVPAGPEPVVLRDPETGEVLRTLEGVEGAKGDGDVMLWDVAEGKVLRPLEGSAGAPTTCVFSPDNKLVAGVTREGLVKLWDVATGKVVHTLGGTQVHGVAFSPDGRKVAGGGRVWDAATGKELLAIAGHQFGMVEVAFSPDGKLLITAGTGPHKPGFLELYPVQFEGEVKVWDAESGKELLAFSTNQTGNLDWACVAPDGEHVLTNGGWDKKTTVLWSLYADK